MKLAPTAKAIVYGVLVDIGGSVLALVGMGGVSAGGWAGTQRKRRSAA